jgi:hypothetical protein
VVARTSLQVGDAALERFEPLEDVVETRPDVGGILDRTQRQRANGTDDRAASMCEEQLERLDAGVEPIELATEHRRDDVGDPPLDIARQGLRLPDDGLTTAREHVSERPERAAGTFHRDLLPPHDRDAAATGA